MLFYKKSISFVAITSTLDMIQTFRYIAFAEGISYLLLLLVAMPLKYFANMPEAVLWTGWVHGLLFMLYVAGALLIKQPAKLSWLELGWVLLGSILPFGPFVIDARILNKKVTA